MTKAHYKSVFLDKVKTFIKNLREGEQGKIAAQVQMMCDGEFGLVYIRPIRSPIKELIVDKYRFLFFMEKQFIYFVHAFIKKTQKTPIREIEYAERVYKKLTQK